jgi:hypothetical protein
MPPLLGLSVRANGSRLTASGSSSHRSVYARPVPDVKHILDFSLVASPDEATVGCRHARARGQLERQHPPGLAGAPPEYARQYSPGLWAFKVRSRPQGRRAALGHDRLGLEILT